MKYYFNTAESTVTTSELLEERYTEYELSTEYDSFEDYMEDMELIEITEFEYEDYLDPRSEEEKRIDWMMQYDERI